MIEVKTIGSDLNPLSGVDVTLNTQSGTTDSTGIVQFEDEETTALTVSKTGYQTFNLTADAGLESIEIRMLTPSEALAEEEVPVEGE